MSSFCRECGYVLSDGAAFDPQCPICVSSGISGLVRVQPDGLLNWRGRVGRLKYFSILCVTTLIGGVPFSFVASGGNASVEALWVALLISSPFLYVGSLAAIKRFHDLDRSGWHSLLFLVPFINLAVGLYLILGKGNTRVNEYGLSVIDQPNAKAARHPLPKSPSQWNGGSSNHNAPTGSLSPRAIAQISSWAGTDHQASVTQLSDQVQGIVGSDLADQSYEQIAQELETNSVHKATWTNAYAQASGDEKQTRVIYIKLRLAKLMLAEQERLKAEMESTEQQIAEDADRLKVEEQRLRRISVIERIRSGLIDAQTAAHELGEVRTKFLGKYFLGTFYSSTLTEIKDAIELHPMLLAIADRKGNSLLHIAVQLQWPDLVRYLLQAGANREAKNHGGKTPLDCARRAGFGMSNTVVDILSARNPCT